MTTEELIKADDFCLYHQIEVTFINSLEEAGLIELIRIEEQSFIPNHELQHLEKMARLYRELDINIPGIEAIVNILQRMEAMQQEIISLKNRLRFYEQGE